VGIYCIPLPLVSKSEHFGYPPHSVTDHTILERPLTISFGDMTTTKKTKTTTMIIVMTTSTTKMMRTIKMMQTIMKMMKMLMMFLIDC